MACAAGWRSADANSSSDASLGLTMSPFFHRPFAILLAAAQLASATPAPAVHRSPNFDRHISASGYFTHSALTLPLVISGAAVGAVAATARLWEEMGHAAGQIHGFSVMGVLDEILVVVSAGVYVLSTLWSSSYSPSYKFIASDPIRNVLLHAVQVAVQKHLVPLLPQKGRVLEIGAGPESVLRKLIGNSLPPGVEYLETDQHPALLTLPDGSFPTLRQLASLPEMSEIESDSVDFLVGLNALDVLDVRGLREAFNGMARVLRPGGRLFMLFDRGPTSRLVSSYAKEKGWIPFGYRIDHQASGTFSLRIAFLNTKKLSSMIQRLRTANGRNEADLIQEKILGDPEKIWNTEEKILPFVRVLAGLGVVVEDVDAADWLADLIREAAEHARLTVDFSAEAEDVEVIIPKMFVSGLPIEMNYVRSRYGGYYGSSTDPNGRVKKGFRRIRYAPFFLAAHKPISMDRVGSTVATPNPELDRVKTLELHRTAPVFVAPGARGPLSKPEPADEFPGPGDTSNPGKPSETAPRQWSNPFEWLSFAPWEEVRPHLSNYLIGPVEGVRLLGGAHKYSEFKLKLCDYLLQQRRMDELGWIYLSLGSTLGAKIHDYYEPLQEDRELWDDLRRVYEIENPKKKSPLNRKLNFISVKKYLAVTPGVDLAGATARLAKWHALGMISIRSDDRYELSSKGHLGISMMDVRLNSSKRPVVPAWSPPARQTIAEEKTESQGISGLPARDIIRDRLHPLIEQYGHPYMLGVVLKRLIPGLPASFEIILDAFYSFKSRLPWGDRVLLELFFARRGAQERLLSECQQYLDRSKTNKKEGIKKLVLWRASILWKIPPALIHELQATTAQDLVQKLPDCLILWDRNVWFRVQKAFKGKVLSDGFALAVYTSNTEFKIVADLSQPFDDKLRYAIVVEKPVTSGADPGESAPAHPQALAAA